MAWEKIVALSKSGSVHRKGRDVANNIGFAIYMSNKQVKSKPQANFIIGMKYIKEMRWMAGDRIDLFVDREEKLGMLKRSINGSGYKLSTCGKKASLKLHTPASDAFPKISSVVNLEAIEITDEGVLFAIPQQQTDHVPGLPRGEKE